MHWNKAIKKEEKHWQQKERMNGATRIINNVLIIPLIFKMMIK